MTYLKKIHLPAVLILLTFYVQFFITKELWLNEHREYPSIPFLTFFPLKLGASVEWILILALFSALLFSLIKPDQKKYLLLFSIPGLLLILDDSIRLQPWFYLHLVMISLIAFEKELSEKTVWNLLKWIVIAIYFWGGFNKLNTAFAWEIFPWFTQPLGIGDDYFLGMDNLHSFPLPNENKIAFIIPVFEMLIALYLLIPKTKWLGIGGVIITHLVSLYAIGPWGHNWNQIVWPWNVEMILLTFILFYKTEYSDVKSFFSQQIIYLKTKTGKLIFGLFFIAPVIGFFGYWHKALSLHLYSGNSDELEFYFEGYEENFVGTSLEQHLYLDTTEMKSMTRVEYWAIEQTGVPMYNDASYFKSVGKYLCDCLTHPETGGIRILKRSGFNSRQDTIQIRCTDLK